MARHLEGPVHLLCALFHHPIAVRALAEAEPAETRASSWIFQPLSRLWGGREPLDHGVGEAAKGAGQADPIALKVDFG